MFTLGFDVSKDKLDGSLINRSAEQKQILVVTNDLAAITKCLKTIRSKHRKLTIGCESTGQYHLNLIRVCLALGLPLKLINPLTTKQYTRATVRGRKTDPDDALTVARLVLRGEGRLASVEDLSLPN